MSTCTTCMHILVMFRLALGSTPLLILWKPSYFHTMDWRSLYCLYKHRMQVDIIKKPNGQKCTATNWKLESGKTSLIIHSKGQNEQCSTNSITWQTANFYHIWTTYTKFKHPVQAPYEIGFPSAQWFLRCLKKLQTKESDDNGQ